MIDFRIDPSEVEKAARRYEAAPRIYQQELARGSGDANRILQAAVAREAPGSIAGSIVAVTEPIQNGFRVVAESRGKPYVRYVVEGTGIYHQPEARRAWTVVPRFKKALRFTSGGSEFIRMRVTIQGQKPNPFFERGLEKARLPLRRNYQATNRRILIRLTGR